MSFSKIVVLAPALILAVACGRRDDRASADSALNRDLNLANQVGPYQDTLSSVENGFAAGAIAPAPRSTARSTTRSSSAAPRTTARRSTSSGRVVTSSGGEVSSRPAEVTVKHTKRDAAIGAAAGAVIGATTSRDKLKGAVIGGVVGGVLGGVIGNNVDKTKKKPPQ
jgi:outer membrane lipoprotein SlyB